MRIVILVVIFLLPSDTVGFFLVGLRWPASRTKPLWYALRWVWHYQPVLRMPAAIPLMVKSSASCSRSSFSRPRRRRRTSTCTRLMGST